MEDLKDKRSWLTHDPRGRPFVETPWSFSFNEQTRRLPVYLRPSRPIHRRLVVYAVFLALMGTVFSWQVLGAFGVGLLATLAWTYRQAWLASGDWQIEQVRAQRSVVEGETAELSFRLTSRSRSVLPEMLIALNFPGSQNPQQTQWVGSSALPTGRIVTFSLVCDRGMGSFPVRPMHVVVRDPLGIFNLCLEAELDLTIEARPRISPINRFPMPQDGLLHNAGAFQTKRPGESCSFLGLREWRHGDGIRKIDWKRSLQGRQLMVKVFEADISSDVSLIFDLSAQSHSEFGGLSSLEAMRDAAVSLAAYFNAQQQRVQLLADDVLVPFGGGKLHRDLLVEQIMQLRAKSGSDFAEQLRNAVALLPSGSMACLLMGTSSCLATDLIELLLALESRRIELFIILFDSEQFARAVTKEANVDGQHLVTIHSFFRTLQTQASGEMGRLLAHLPERTFVIKPGDRLSEVMEQRA